MFDPSPPSSGGMDLTPFRPGHVYEVDPSIGSYFVLTGFAEPSSDEAPALVVRTDEVMVGVFAGNAPLYNDVADEWEDDGPPHPAA